MCETKSKSSSLYHPACCSHPQPSVYLRAQLPLIPTGSLQWSLLPLLSAAQCVFTRNDQTLSSGAKINDSSPFLSTRLPALHLCHCCCQMQSLHGCHSTVQSISWSLLSLINKIAGYLNSSHMERGLLPREGCNLILSQITLQTAAARIRHHPRGEAQTSPAVEKAFTQILYVSVKCHTWSWLFPFHAPFNTINFNNDAIVQAHLHTYAFRYVWE